MKMQFQWMFILFLTYAFVSCPVFTGVSFADSQRTTGRENYTSQATSIQYTIPHSSTLNMIRNSRKEWLQGNEPYPPLLAISLECPTFLYVIYIDVMSELFGSFFSYPQKR